MAGSQYFEAAPEVTSRPETVSLCLPDVTLRLTTDRGVFAHGDIDVGSKLLLLEAPVPAAAGDLLDLGCGYGPIALTMARRAPAATVWAVDVNERARALCAANAEANGITNVRVVAPHEVPSDVTFATMWSNPPIRIGKAALHVLLLRWLAKLAPDGSAVLVVQKHLGADSLAAWLAAEGWSTTRLAARLGYRMIGVTR